MLLFLIRVHWIAEYWLNVSVFSQKIQYGFASNINIDSLSGSIFIIPSCQWYDLVLFCLINKQVIKYDHNMQWIDINSILRPVNEWCAPSNASIYYMLLSHMQTFYGMLNTKKINHVKIFVKSKINRSTVYMFWPSRLTS